MIIKNTDIPRPGEGPGATLTDCFDRAVRAYLDRTGHDRVELRAALCVMDGTLYDSMPRHAEAWHRMMLTQGLDIPPERFFLLEGRTGASTLNQQLNENLARTLTPEQCKELYAVKSENFHRLQQQSGISPKPGAQRVVARCMERGITPVLVTGSGQSTLIDCLDRDYPGAFSAALRVTSHNVTHGKPHPEPYLKALDMAGVTANNAFVLENAPLGVDAGAAAGVFTLAVRTGPVPEDDLDGAGADLVFPSMPALAAVFDVLLDRIARIRLM